jgi:hypothetical protein
VETVRPVRDGCLLHLRHVLEDADVLGQTASELRERVATVVEDAQGLGGTDCMPIEIGEHLLRSLQPRVHEEYYGAYFIAQFRAFLQRSASGSAAAPGAGP